MKRKKVYIVAFTILTISIFWISLWFYFAKKNETQFLNWFNSSKNIEKFKFTNLKTRGFPNRIDLTFENFEIFVKKPKIEIFVKIFQIFNVLYQKDHTIISFHPEIKMKFKDKKILFETKNFLTSIKENIVTSEIEELKIKFNKKNKIILNQILISKKFDMIDREEPISFFLKSKNINFPEKLIKNIDALSISGTFENKDSYIINLENAIFELEKFNFNCNGKLEIKNNKITKGNLKFNVENWKNILVFFKENNLLDTKKITLIENGFTMLEIFHKNKPINVEVFLDNEFIYIGSVKIRNIYDLDYFF